MISIGSERLNVHDEENLRQHKHQLVHGNSLPPTSPGPGLERPARPSYRGLTVRSRRHDPVATAPAGRLTDPKIGLTCGERCKFPNRAVRAGHIRGVDNETARRCFPTGEIYRLPVTNKGAPGSKPVGTSTMLGCPLHYSRKWDPTSLAAQE